MLVVYMHSFVVRYPRITFSVESTIVGDELMLYRSVWSAKSVGGERPRCLESSLLLRHLAVGFSILELRQHHLVDSQRF
jgi:hypothetical protein